MVEAVLFDLDGTIIDSEPIFVCASQYMCEKMGFTGVNRLIMSTIGMSAEESNAVYRRVFGPKYSIKEAYSYYHDYVNQHYRKHGAVPAKTGIRTLLRWSKNRGYKLGIASNKSVGYINQFLALGGVRPDFDVIIGEEHAYYGKGGHNYHEIACKELGVSPADTVVVDDSPHGILSAFKAGTMPIVVPDLIECDAKTEELVMAKCANLFDVIEVIKALDARE